MPGCGDMAYISGRSFCTVTDAVQPGSQSASSEVRQVLCVHLQIFFYFFIFSISVYAC